MKNTKQAFAALLFALLVAIFVVGCSDGSYDSGNYNSASQFYGTYASSSVNVSTISFTFTSTSWSCTANGASTRPCPRLSLTS